jgi:hypothetical protein
MDRVVLVLPRGKVAACEGEDYTTCDIVESDEEKAKKEWIGFHGRRGKRERRRGGEEGTAMVRCEERIIPRPSEYAGSRRNYSNRVYGLLFCRRQDLEHLQCSCLDVLLIDAPRQYTRRSVVHLLRYN